MNFLLRVVVSPPTETLKIKVLSGETDISPGVISADITCDDETPAAYRGLLIVYPLSSVDITEKVPDNDPDKLKYSRCILT